MKIHRLFVGNVPAGTSETELKQEFSNYGSVKAIDLKSKPNALNDSVDTFAFINIELDDRTLWQCINEFRQEKYKGVYLNVSKAKESFLDRLKREREEAEAAKQKSDVLNPYKKTHEPEAAKKDVEALPILPTIAKPAESSSSESSSEEEDEPPAPPPARRSVVASKKASEDDQLVKKWNQETFIEHGKLKIVPITGQVKEVIDNSKSRNQQSNSKELDEKARLADEKRKQGLTKLQSAYEQQKLAIQAALAGSGDGVKRKKIVFEDEDDESSKKQKLSLFDDEDGEDGFKANFNVRKQLAENTERGQQLYDMQTQFHGDSRFKLDERFLGDDTVAGRKKKTAFDTEKASIDKNGAKLGNSEKKKQLEILSKVTGKEIHQREQKEIVGPKGMQRFDPSVMKEVPKKEKLPTEKEILEAKRAERPEEVYQVTEEKFYKVSGGLSQAIGAKTEGFSLLSMFGSVKAENDVDDADDEQQQLQEKPIFSNARFRYESSASEDEDGKPTVAEEPTVVDEAEEGSKKKKKKSGYLSKQGIWKENFFFMPNDARLEEGRKFFTEFASSAAEANANAKDEQVKDIRKIFKKRRMRETKIVNQIRARRGLKLMKGKRK